MKSKDIIFLSTADWDNPFWTNKQHVAVELNKCGNRIIYIDSLGLRRPSVSGRDMQRIFRRLLKAVRPPRMVRNNLWIWSPLVLPWNTYAFIRKVNRMLLSGGLWFWCKYLGIKKQWLWTYNPLTTEFFTLDDFECRIYHCVDEIKAQPGMPVNALEMAEKELLSSVDIVFATSLKLTESRRIYNNNTHYLPNVADFSHFSTAQLKDIQIPNDLHEIKSPRLGFVGALSGYKIDFELIRIIALTHPEWSIVLIGEIGEGDPWTDSELLCGVSNIYILGPRDYKDLPAYMKGFDVALMPYKINEYTESMFPMKFFEYMAAGCPVVSVNINAIREFKEVVSLADSYDEFIKSIELVLDGNAPPLEKRLGVAREYTYEHRNWKMLKLINETCVP